MTREEQIIEKGIEYTLNHNPMCLGGDNFAKQVKALNRNYSFESGAKWADEHPVNVWHNKSLIDLIPNKIQVVGQDIDVSIVDSIEDGYCGISHLCGGYIKIADKANGYIQSDSSKLNTFIHECVHLIFRNIGRGDLSNDEALVVAFLGSATEIIRSILNQK